MSSEKVMEASELRAELARRRITRVEIARALGLSFDYVAKILCGRRKAVVRRREMQEYLERQRRIAQMGGDKSGDCADGRVR